MKKMIPLLAVLLAALLFSGPAGGEGNGRVSPGDIMTFGHYEQDGDLSDGTENIEWTVLDVQENSALLISRYGLDSVQYNTERAEVTWETCSLREWLNGDFLCAAFSEEEQETIIESVQDYYNMKLGVVQEDLADNFRLSMMLLIGGIICLAIYLYFRDLIASNVILIIPTWFMFEEFINVFWLNRGEILEEQMNYAQLSSMKIIFQEHFVDDYISEESEEEIIKEIFDE